MKKQIKELNLESQHELLSEIIETINEIIEENPSLQRYEVIVDFEKYLNKKMMFLLDDLNKIKSERINYYEKLLSNKK